MIFLQNNQPQNLLNCVEKKFINPILEEIKFLFFQKIIQFRCGM